MFLHRIQEIVTDLLNFRKPYSGTSHHKPYSLLLRLYVPCHKFQLSPFQLHAKLSLQATDMSTHQFQYKDSHLHHMVLDYRYMWED